MAPGGEKFRKVHRAVKSVAEPLDEIFSGLIQLAGTTTSHGEQLRLLDRRIPECILSSTRQKNR
jgi:hypothetical protein